MPVFFHVGVWGSVGRVGWGVCDSYFFGGDGGAAGAGWGSVEFYM